VVAVLDVVGGGGGGGVITDFLVRVVDIILDLPTTLTTLTTLTKLTILTTLTMTMVVKTPFGTTRY
jgi:hypothetical protein